MKSVNAIMTELYLQCKECGISCLAIIGDKENYDVEYTEDYDAIGENLYFALCNDKELLATVANAVKVASKFVAEKDNNED